MPEAKPRERRITRPNAGDETGQLVKAAQEGDRLAFDELTRRYRDRIVALALHLTGSRSDAEDIAQEVFLRAYKQINTFEGRSEFFTWVYRIAVNRSLNCRRDRKVRRTSDLDDPRVQAAIAVDAYGDPRKAAELRQTYTRLMGALDQLSPTLRTTVVLVSLQGMSHEEAAVILACPVGTIAWRMHEARGQLQDSMADLRAAAPSKEERRERRSRTPANGMSAHRSERAAPPPIPGLAWTLS
jgi:RNA polymerase sigma-70 factor (ECF subfamily)